jgi:hypothetical protein
LVIANVPPRRLLRCLAIVAPGTPLVYHRFGLTTGISPWPRTHFHHRQTEPSFTVTLALHSLVMQYGGVGGSPVQGVSVRGYDGGMDGSLVQDRGDGGVCSSSAQGGGYGSPT